MKLRVGELGSVTKVLALCVERPEFPPYCKKLDVVVAVLFSVKWGDRRQGQVDP